MKYAKTLFPGPVSPRTPRGRETEIAQPPDAAHHGIQVGHFECDVIQRGGFRLRERERVMLPVAAHEGHVPRAVRHGEAEAVGGEARARLAVERIEDDMRELDRRLGTGDRSDRLAIRNESEHLSLRRVDEEAAGGAGLVERPDAVRRRCPGGRDPRMHGRDLVFRAGERDGRGPRGGGFGQRNEVWMVAGAAEKRGASAPARV